MNENMQPKLKRLIQISLIVLLSLFVINETKPKFAPFFIKKGKGAFEAGNLNESLMFTKIASQLDPLEPQVYYILGEIYAKRSIYSAAIREHKKAIELNPMLAKSYYALGQIYFQIKEYALAFGSLDKALEINPENQQIKESIESTKHNYALELINDAVDMYQSGYREDARKLLELVFKLRYSHMYNLFEIININKKNPSSDKLISSLEKVLRLDPEYKLAYKLIGDLYLESADYKKARDAYKKFLSIEPNDASIHYNLAVAYNRLGALDSAINDFRVALSLIPDNPNIIYGIAFTYKEKKMFDEAMNLYQHLIKSGYDFPYIYLDLAEIYKEEGDIEQAKKQMDLAIKIAEEKISLDSPELFYRIILEKAFLLKEAYGALQASP